MKRIALAAALALMLTPTAAFAVRISGLVTYSGGPLFGKVYPAPGVPVRVLSPATNRVVAQTTSGEGGTFHLRLAPGRDIFRALNTSPPHRPCVTRQVIVRRTRTKSVALGCSIK
jgi:hypothetical protein